MKRTINTYIQSKVAREMIDPSEAYPQHQKFKDNREELYKIKDFVEWLVSKECPRPRSKGYECLVCDAEDIVPIHCLNDKQKEELILEYFGIDLFAFTREKEQMVQELTRGSDAK